MSYVSQKQLGGVITITDVDESGAISDTSDGTQRAVVFHQDTVDIVVTFASPVPVDPHLFTVTNRGTVPITISNVDGEAGISIPPGPAYGVFWNGSEYVSEQVEGVGTVSNIEDTATISLTGDGSGLTPLKADVKLSADSGNSVEARDDGLYFAYTNIGVGTVVYVDGANGFDTNPGTLKEPVKTINQAISIVGTNDYHMIVVFPGTYTENIQYPHSEGLFILGFGSVDASQVKLVGGVNLGDSTRPKMRDINVVAPSGTIALVVDETSHGSMAFENVSLSSDDGLDATVVSFVDGATGWYNFHNCGIAGVFDMTLTSTASAYIEGGTEETGIILSGNTAQLVVANKLSMGTINHEAGALTLKNILTIKKDANGNSINSTANTGLLALFDVSTIQQDGSFGDIIKTGTCPYMFGSLHIDPANDTFTGARVFVDNAHMIHANFASPANYSPSDQSVTGHLQGIDDKLGDVAGGLSSVSSSDSVSIDFSGVGTSASPLTANVKRSQSPGNALAQQSDGLYVPTPSGGLSEVDHSNSNNVSLSGLGTQDDPLVADVFIDGETDHNMLATGDNGLKVIPSQPTVALAFTINHAWIENEILWSYVTPDDFTIPANFAGSTGAVKMPDSTTLDANIRFYVSYDPDNYFGSIAIASNVMTFSFSNGGSSDVVVPAGTQIWAVAQEDASFDNVAFTLKGNRQFFDDPPLEVPTPPSP